MPGPADYIAQGTAGILRAEENKGEALAKLGGAIGYGVSSLGVGIFRMAAKAKEEKEKAAIDEAFKGLSLTGDPMTVMKGAEPARALATTPGAKAHYLKRMEEIRGNIKMYGDWKADEAMTAWRKAQATDEPNELARKEAAELRAAAAERRAQEDQDEQLREAKAREASEGILGGRSAGDITDEELGAIPDPKIKGIIRREREGTKRFEETAEARRTKEDAARRFRENKARGLVTYTDPDTGEEVTAPDVSSERFAVQQKARDESMGIRRESLALAKAAEARAARAEGKKDRATAIDEKREALAGYQKAYNASLDPNGDPHPWTDEVAVKGLFDKIQALGKEVGETPEDGGARPPDAIDRYLEGKTPEQIDEILRRK